MFWGWVLLFLLWTPLRSFAQAPPPREALLEDKAFAPALAARISQARRSIVCAFYLFKIKDRPGNLPRQIAGELIKAARRGVEVTVILEGGDQVGPENQAAASVLARGGVRVVFPRGRRVTHTKAVAIDERYLFIGSHNLTQAALGHNHETSLFLDSPQLAAQLKGYLQRLQ